MSHRDSVDFFDGKLVRSLFLEYVRALSID